jgi:hypothetical protein
MSQLFPKGLMNHEFEILMKCSIDADLFSIDEMKEKTDQYFIGIERAYERNSIVNVKLAAAIVASIHIVCFDWETIPEIAKPWCKGMIQYFIKTDDDENDLKSPIGFDDDAQVLNACLKFASRPDLCVDPEEYDDL